MIVFEVWFVKVKMQFVCRPLFLALATLGVAGCSTESPSNPVRGGAGLIGFATTVPEAKDFVRASRTNVSDLAYVPIGRQEQQRATPARSIADVASLQQQLDQVRDQSEGTARSNLPTGAFGRALPSVARPASASAPAAAPARPSADGSYPVNPNRLRQIRENAQKAQQQQQ